MEKSIFMPARNLIVNSKEIIIKESFPVDVYDICITWCGHLS
jgi:hypothetical protein